MKWVLVLLIVFVSAFGTKILFPNILKALSDNEMKAEIQRFIQKYAKLYKPEELSYRFQIFSDNMKYINNWNANPSSSFRLKMNQFGDLSHLQFKYSFIIGPIFKNYVDNN